MADILLVFCPQQQDFEVEQIRKQLPLPHRTQQERNCETGLRQLQQRHFDLVIVGSALAGDSGEPVSDGGGLDFCRRARLLTDVPMLLLAPAVPAALQRAAAVIPGVVAYPDLATTGAFALELLQSAARVEPILSIRVTAVDRDWRFDIDGIDFKFHGDGKLNISSSSTMLWNGTEMVEANWYEKYRKIGQSIRAALCDDNPHFKAQLELGRAAALQQLGEVGKRVADRITFEVSEGHFPLMLEAVFDPSPREEPWLAQASSMSRRLLATGAPTRDDLFAGPTTARRALLICANTDGTAYSRQLKGGVQKLEPLKWARFEIERVKKLLTTQDPRTGQSLFTDKNIEVLGLKAPVTRADLDTALRSGVWDLIHFCGHTHFQEHGVGQAGGTGFLFVGPPGEPECVDFGEISVFMGRARFVYLSSCESGTTGFATLAAAAGIHAVLGYRCRVKDLTAAIQARIFYRMLLRNHSLGSAFGFARRRVYRHYRHLDNAWASAMLLTPELRT